MKSYYTSSTDPTFAVTVTKSSNATNVAQRQASVDPHTKLTDLDCCYRLHPPTICHRFVTQLIIILPSHVRTEGRMSWPRHCSKVCSLCKAVYHMITVVLVTNIQTVCDRI